MTRDRCSPSVFDAKQATAEVSSALVASWRRLVDGLAGGWGRTVDGAIAGVTGISVPSMNGVWCADAAIDPAVVSELVAAVAADKVPWCLQFPTGAPALAALAAERGMSRDDDVPLMRLDGMPNEPIRPDVRIRQLDPDHADEHADLAARGFGAPLEMFTPLASPPLSAEPGLAYYVGDVDDQPVTTGLGLRIDGYVGVFNIATPPGYRRHGYGAAITAHIVRDAYANGAGWAWLQSSPDGHTIYQRLGFTTVSTWECWTSQ